ncbi:MAG: glycine betaine ABC transporter substrate-binding protein, partial [Oscillospiraceae bacterium]
LILLGTGALMVIAVVLDTLMGAFERRIRKNRGSSKRIWLSAAVVLAALILALPFGLRDTTGENELLLYDGDYSETQIMHHMVKMLVEDKTDLTVTIQDQMSQVNNFKSLIGDGHTCDLMISYDGTLLTTFLHLDPADVPEGMTLYDYANEVAMEQHGVRLLGKLGFDNTYAIAVPEVLAEQYDLHTVSDLVAVAPQLSFGAEHEFFTEEGSMKYGPFTAFYGLNFRSVVPVDVSLKYAAVENGSFDVTEVFATDGLNRKANLRVLEDDRSFFPDYNGALLVREDVFERFADAAPNLEEVLNLLAGQISNDDMVEMTYQVDVMGRTVDDVAREFLVARGLIEG